MIRPELDDNDLSIQSFALDSAFRQVGAELQQHGAGAAQQAIVKLQGLLGLMEKLRAGAVPLSKPAANGDAEHADGP